MSLRWERGPTSGAAHRLLRLSAAALADSSVKIQLDDLAVPAAMSYEDHPKVQLVCASICGS